MAGSTPGEFSVYGVRIHPAKSAVGYRASANARRIAAFDHTQFSALGRQLDAVEVDTLVLSSEGWLPQASLFERAFRIWQKPMRVIAYVRPQANYLNAAWWQWGAWEDVGLEAWLTQRLPASFWSVPLAEWRDTPFVEELSIRLLPEEVVGDFLAALGVTRHVPPSVRINTSLPAPILRLFQRNRKLRPTKYAAEIDFALARHVAYRGSAPWVLARKTVEDIIAKARPSNEQLLHMLRPDMAEKMRSDPRWWDADAFAGEKVEPWEPQPPKVEELERLSLAMAEAILRMDGEIRKPRMTWLRDLGGAKDLPPGTLRAK